MKLLKVDSIEEVEQKFETYFGALEKTEEVELRKSYGRYLAEDVFADLDSPSFRRSVVDGYAVRAADTFGVSNSVPVFGVYWIRSNGRGVDAEHRFGTDGLCADGRHGS